MPKFVLRKIRNGRVKVAGKRFEPSPECGSLDGRVIPYTGQLNGQVWLFGRYENHQPPMLALWGSKEAYEASKNYDPNDPDNAFYRASEKAPNIINGVIQWYFWREIAQGPPVTSVRSSQF